MVPTDFKDFMIVSTGASSVLIGLLFVAVTDVINKAKSKEIAIRDKVLAETSFVSLMIIFFISISALIPNAAIGQVAFWSSLVGYAKIFHLIRYHWNVEKSWLQSGYLTISFVIYTSQLICSEYIIRNPGNNSYITDLVIILLFLYGLSLTRAWSLIGIRNSPK